MYYHLPTARSGDIKAYPGEGFFGDGPMTGMRSKSPIAKSPFAKSPFAGRPMVKRALFSGNQLGLLSVYKSVEIDKKVLDWF